MTNETLSGQKTPALLTFDEAMARVKREVTGALSNSPRIIREYTLHLAATQGKGIRAVSLLTCSMNEERRIHPDAVLFAAAVELLHLATLVHDDIIDDAQLRRGAETLQKKYGKRTAVICGDFLLCLSLEMVGRVKRRDDYLAFELPAHMKRLCLGELNQHVHSKDLNLSAYRYLKIINGKTAALFEACFFAGAILSESDPKRIAQYRRMGHYLGMIFQLTDDCNDFEASEAAAQKPVQSDYEQGVVTLPLIYALHSEEGFRNQMQEGHLSRKDLNQAVLHTGGLRFTHAISKRYYGKFVKQLDKLSLSPEKSEKLLLILKKAYEGLSPKAGEKE